MADIVEKTTYPDAATAISQGKRHFLVQDYEAAVTALAEGLEMMSQKLGECDDELGEPYLLYGRALLGLAREEAGVLGGCVPGSEDADEDEEEEVDDDEEDEEEEKLSEVDEKDEAMDTSESAEKKDGVEAKKKDSETKGESSEKKDQAEKKDSTTKDSVEKSEKNVDAPKKDSEKKDGAEKSEKEVVDAQKKDSEKKDGAEKKDPEKKDENSTDKKPAATNKTDDKKIEDQKSEKKDQPEKNAVEGVAGSSKDPLENGKHEACNGKAGKSKDVADDDDVNNEDEEEDPGRGIDLQLAWEVLELAKIVFDKRGEKGRKQLAETHRLLGEVAMESDNPQGAIADLEGALKLLEKLEPPEPRAIAEIHYQLGLAYSLANDFDASIKQFGEATSRLEARIKQLEDHKDEPKSNDPFYTIEGEIKELRELLPAIQEKITDMKDFKEEACKLVIEGIKNSVAGGSCTNGAGTSNNDAATSSSATSNETTKISKPASDISHLVRKKRKADEPDDAAQSPCKKTP